jgi:hypothetical protein
MKIYSWLIDIVGLSTKRTQQLTKSCLSQELATTQQLAAQKSVFAEVMQDVDLDEWEAAALLEALSGLHSSNEADSNIDSNLIDATNGQIEPSSILVILICPICGCD